MIFLKYPCRFKLKKLNKIILDDYSNKNYHHIIKKNYFVKKYGRLAILKTKINIKFPKSELCKYSSDPK